MQVIDYENLPQAPRPADVLTAWRRDQGIDRPLPATPSASTSCAAKNPDGAAAELIPGQRSGELRHLGLHRDQVRNQ